MRLREWRQHCGLPGNEANLLITAVTAYPPARIISALNDPLPPQYLPALETLCRRRLQGEPMAYILGSKEFYGRDFAVGPEVLIPRPETEHLIDYILDNFPAAVPLAVWDLGTGSGIIAISLKLARPRWQVYASDLSTAALRLARRNGTELKADINWGEGSWFNLTTPWDIPRFDILVANPPYIAGNDAHLRRGDLRFEPRLALTDEEDGLQAYRSITREAPNYLKPAGTLCLEHGFDQGEKVRELLAEQKFQHIKTYRDYADLERFTVTSTHG